MDVGEAALYAVVVEGKPFMVEAEKVQDCGMKVVRGDQLIDRFKAELVGSSEAHTSLYAGASEPGSEAMRVVVTAVGAGLKHWHSAELGSKHDECVF